MGRDRQHKRFSPSQAERFTACIGSTLRIESAPPRDPTPYQLEGILAHEILEEAVRTFKINAAELIQDRMDLGEEIEIGVKFGVNTALDYIWGVYDELETLYGDTKIFVETFVNPPVSSAPDEAGGFCDVAIYSQNSRKLYIIDYKHGYVTKAVEGNAQASQYAAGFLFGEGSPVKADEIDEVILVIIQPNAFHPMGEIREWRVNPAVIFDYLMDLDAVIEKAQDPSAVLTPGYQQCRFCPVRSTCPALEASGLAIINPELQSYKDVAESHMPAPRTLDVNRLSYIKQMLPLLKAWIADIDDHVNTLVKSGITVPGFKEVQAYGKREWYGDKLEIGKKLAALAGVPVEEVYVHKLINITDADKLVANAFKDRVGRSRKKQAAEEANKMLAYLTTKKETADTTVVAVTDPRPPVDKASRAFGGIAGLISPPPTERN